MNDKDDLYNRLVKILATFSSKPYILAKMLVEMDLLSSEMKNMLLNNKNLDTIEPDDVDKYKFNNINDMNNYYLNIITGKYKLSNNDEIEDIESITKEYNRRLSLLVNEEKYEEAAKLKKYMDKHSIKIIREEEN